MVEGLEAPIDSIVLANNICLESNWFAVKKLDSNTLAIGEPAYHQCNWSYLISDSSGSVLFDTGSGRRAISRVVRRHSADLVFAFPSHMHFDHLGGIDEFDHVLIADLPIIRRITKNEYITPTSDMFLGHMEGVTPPTFRASQWIKPGDIVPLNIRHLKVLHTPGHSPDSVSLWEPDRNRLFAADLIYPGALYAHIPGSSLKDYQQTVSRLLDILPVNVSILCGHGGILNSMHDVPYLQYKDLEDLHTAIDTILRGNCAADGELYINERIRIRYSRDSLQ